MYNTVPPRMCALVVFVLAGLMPCNAQTGLVPMWSPDVPTTTTPLAVMIAPHVAFGDDVGGSDTKADVGVTVAGRYLLLKRFTVSFGGGLTKRDSGPVGERDAVPHLVASAAAGLFHSMFGEDGEKEAAFSLVGGYGYASLPGPAKENNLTAGLDIHLVFWIIEPWISPRIHWRRTTLTSGSQWQHGPALAAGTSLGLNFAALFLAGEYLRLGETDGGLPPADCVALSLGLQLAW